MSQLENLVKGNNFLIKVYTIPGKTHCLRPSTTNRQEELKEVFHIGHCNITKCCTEVCPEDITITDKAVIPLKERVTGAFYDPLAWLWRSLTFVSK